MGSFLSNGTRRWELPADRASVTIGRAPTADIRLGDELVSRLHARLVCAGGTWSITDDGMSRNGTILNGHRLVDRVPLRDNDQIQVGQTVLTFHDSAYSEDQTRIAPPQYAVRSEPPQHVNRLAQQDTADQQRSAERSGGSRVRLTRVILIAAAVDAVGLLGNAIATLVGDQAGSLQRWIAPHVISILTAVITALIEATGSKEPAPAAAPATSTTAAPPRRRGTPAAAAILVVLLVVGVGGFAVTAGVQYATGYFTGKESGQDRLVKPVSKSGSGVTLTVEKVTHTRHFTRVELTARNTSRSALTLPLFGNCTFTAADGTTLEADAFRSQWSETLAPGALQRGTITFPDHLPAAATKASLSFSHIFGPGAGSITVSGINLTPP